MAHYGIEPRTIHVASPNENGDVESSNGASSARSNSTCCCGAAATLRIGELRSVLVGDHGEAQCRTTGKLAEELAVMPPLKVAPWPQMREVTIRVGNNGISGAEQCLLGADGLKGKHVTVKVYEWRIEVWYAGKRMETIPRMIGCSATRSTTAT